MDICKLVVAVFIVIISSGCGGENDSPSSIDIDSANSNAGSDDPTSNSISEFQTDSDGVIRAFDFLHGVDLRCDNRRAILNFSGDSSLARCPNCGIIPDATYYSMRLPDGTIWREGTWHLDDFFGYPTIIFHNSSAGETYRITDDGQGIRVREFHDRPTRECRPI